MSVGDAGAGVFKHFPNAGVFGEVCSAKLRGIVACENFQSIFFFCSGDIIVAERACGYDYLEMFGLAGGLEGVVLEFAAKGVEERIYDNPGSGFGARADEHGLGSDVAVGEEEIDVVVVIYDCSGCVGFADIDGDVLNGGECGVENGVFYFRGLTV